MHTVYIFDDWPISFASHLLDLLSLLGIVDGADAERSGGCCTKPNWAACDPLPRCNRETPGPTGKSFVEREADRQNTVRKRRLRHLYKNPIVCQDRLGTNIGKAEKE
jgi:hypothetical protein